jgi:hypothetical protein
MITSEDQGFLSTRVKPGITPINLRVHILWKFVDLGVKSSFVAWILRAIFKSQFDLFRPNIMEFEFCNVQYTSESRISGFRMVSVSDTICVRLSNGKKQDGGYHSKAGLDISH